MLQRSGGRGHKLSVVVILHLLLHDDRPILSLALVLILVFVPDINLLIFLIVTTRLVIVISLNFYVFRLLLFAVGRVRIAKDN